MKRTAIFSAPVATLFIIAGLLFLAIGVVGSIKGRIQPGKTGRIMSGVAGAILIVMGLLMHQKSGEAITHPPTRSQTESATQSATASATQTPTVAVIPASSTRTPSGTPRPTSTPTPTNTPIIQPGPISVNVNSNPRIVSPGGSTEITVFATASDGSVVQNAQVIVSAGGGSFQDTGATKVVGTTNGRGVFNTTWRAYEANAYAGDASYNLVVEVSRKGIGSGKGEIQIFVRK